MEAAFGRLEFLKPFHRCLNGTKDLCESFPGGPQDQYRTKSKRRGEKMATTGKKRSILWRVDKLPPMDKREKSN